MISIRDYVEINKSLVPYSFDILLADEWFELEINYNETADLYTVTVRKDDKVIGTEPMILGVPLFKDTYQQGFPSVTLVPYDPNGVEKAVTKENLNDKVFLSIDDEGDEDEGI